MDINKIKKHYEDCIEKFAQEIRDNEVRIDMCKSFLFTLCEDKECTSCEYETWDNGERKHKCDYHNKHLKNNEACINYADKIRR